MITEIRNYYKPFEYDWAYDFYRKQQLVHWTKDEIKLSEDLQNWKSLSQTEKDVIGGILKGFVQMEVLIGDYWRRIAQWFPKPEIAMMASAFSYFESIHIDNYAMLNEQLNLDNFKEFVQDETTKQKLDYFLEPRGEDILEKAKSLAIFSAFGEGVLVFSSFAVLLSFQKENLMKGIGQIISFSVRDENLHSEGGIKLFNTICEEYLKKGVNIRETIKNDIKKAAEIVYELEEKFIDSIFNNFNEIRTITKEQLKNFIKDRINKKILELGYIDLDMQIFDVDKFLLEETNWFYYLSGAREFGDFFATRITEYTKVEYGSADIF